MNENVRKILEDLYRDTATLSIEGEKLNAELVFRKGKLTAFMISYEGDRTLRIYGEGNKVEINIYYLKEKKVLRMLVGKKNLLKEFSNEPGKSEAKVYLESLLEYINSLADGRVRDVVDEIKMIVEKGVKK